MLKKLKNLLNAEVDPAFAKRAEYIFTQIEIHKPKNVLDIGCGRGFYVNALTIFPFIQKIEGIDLNEEYLKKAQENINNKNIYLQAASVYKLPFKNDSFECIILSEVLEHLQFEKKALEEIKRVLKKNGLLLITVPSKNFPFLWDPLNFILMNFFNTHINKDIWWLAGMWAGHLRLYKKDELERKINDANLYPTEIKTFLNHCWPFSHLLLYGIGKNIVERLGINSFNRFDFRKKSLSSILASVMRFPSKFDSKNPNQSVTIVMSAIKK